MELKDLLEQYAGFVMDRQHALRERLGRHDWLADTESGIAFFGGPDLESRFEIIGTTLGGGDWLWGWANASLPGDLAEISGKLRDIGRAEGIDLFTRKRFAATREDLHVMGLAACVLGGAKDYYIADYDDGLLLLALTGEGIIPDWRPDHLRIPAVFREVTRFSGLDHKKALRHYLTFLGYEVNEDDGFTAAVDGRSVVATFDDSGRLIDLQTK